MNIDTVMGEKKRGKDTCQAASISICKTRHPRKKSAWSLRYQPSWSSLKKSTPVGMVQTILPLHLRIWDFRRPSYKLNSYRMPTLPCTIPLVYYNSANSFSNINLLISINEVKRTVKQHCKAWTLKDGTISAITLYSMGDLTKGINLYFQYWMHPVVIEHSDYWGHSTIQDVHSGYGETFKKATTTIQEEGSKKRYFCV